MTDATLATGTYMHGHHASVVQSHARRTAETEGAFFLPHLKPGMRLLDVGCGPGSITVGLAQRVAPGAAIGVDSSDSVVATAREYAAQLGAANLTFETGDVYAPRFAQQSFDAIFVHMVLHHLTRPVDALKSLKTLLKPGGVLGVREVDWGHMIHFPHTEGVQRFLDTYLEIARHNGSQQTAGRQLRRWFREAGFGDVRIGGSLTTYADAAATRTWGDTYAERTLKSSFSEMALKHRLATQADLQAMSDAWRSWSRDPDAFFAYPNTEVVAISG